MTGTVYLIGAGPGDPGLITVRGRELLRGADVVVYDRLVHPALLRESRPNAERVYAGKASSHHSMKQADINAILIDRAHAGLRVARLKGGDPFVFGRGGEEAEACEAAGIPYIVVPGVSSAIAVPAYAGIPVTHRDLASSFAVITGHERSAAHSETTEERRDWATIARGADTLVFLMGVGTLASTVDRLLANGRTPDTPAALIQWGTWAEQRVVTGTLATIVSEAIEQNIQPPSICVVGDVVRLHDTLRWYEERSAMPLLGKTVVVTRAREQASTMTALLEAHGACPVEFPVIRIAPPETYGLLDAALQNLASFNWIVFTSVNTVAVVADRLMAFSHDARSFAPVRIAAIGPGTAAALKDRLGLLADFVPSEAVAESIIAEWPEHDMAGKRVLLPRAEQARDYLPNHLEGLGADVTVVTAYRTLLDSAGAGHLLHDLEARRVDAVTFTSSSTVRNFVESLGGQDRVADLRDGFCVAAIGPITAQTAEELGLTPDVVAHEHTIPGLVAALEEYYREC